MGKKYLWYIYILQRFLLFESLSCNLKHIYCLLYVTFSQLAKDSVFNMGCYLSQAGHKFAVLPRMTLVILTSCLHAPKARTVTIQLIYAVLGIKTKVLCLASIQPTDLYISSPSKKTFVLQCCKQISIGQFIKDLVRATFPLSLEKISRHQIIPTTLYTLQMQIFQCSYPK